MQPLLADVIVNGVVIPAARIGAEAQMHAAPKGKPGLAWRAAARALAMRELLLQEARASGLESRVAELGPGTTETDDESLVRQVLELAVVPEPVDEDALKARYDADPGSFRAPPLWEVSHILFAADPADAPARQAARQAAEATLADLSRNPQAWDRLARERSACPSAAQGGRLGQMGPGDTVAGFETALRRLAPDETAPEPVETQFGFHVIRLDDGAPGAVLPWAVVAPRLREAAEKVAWVRAAQAYSRDLARRAELIGVDLE